MRGSEDDFSAFVAARSRHLLHAAHLLTGDRHRAEDLLQTALTRAYLRWDRIDSEDPEGYVRRTMVNAQTDWWRRKPWREQSTDEVPETGGVDDAAAYDVRDAVLGALATLSGRQRAVIVLRYFEGHTYDEIAELMGSRASTVRAQASTALAKLRLEEEVR